MRTGNGIGIWRGNNGVTDGVALIPQNSYGHDEDNGLFFYVLSRRLYYSNNENVQITVASTPNPITSLTISLGFSSLIFFWLHS